MVLIQLVVNNFSEEQLIDIKGKLHDINNNILLT